MLDRLVNGGVQFVPMARVVRIDGDRLSLASSYGQRVWELDGFDSVVLVTGSIPDDALYRELRSQRSDVHLLGDAFAPRRMVFATRQAFALAQTLLS